MSLPLQASGSQSQDDVIFLGDMMVERAGVGSPGELGPSGSWSQPGNLGMAAPPASSAAALLELQPWEDGVLPLVFMQGVTQAQKQIVFRACAEWSAAAQVRCQEGPYQGRTLAVGPLTSGCWAPYGMGYRVFGIRRRINLGAGCWTHETVLHELGHAFGLIHEHQRPDRDQYVEILGENIASGFLGLALKLNFNPLRMGRRTAYDFDSIMHYSHDAFSRDGQDTIRPRPAYQRYLYSMGNQRNISRGDAAMLAAIYGAR